MSVLGGDPAHPSAMIELRAPVSGTIVEQNISGFEGIKSLDNSPNLFTIADLSQVWVLCDVYENDLGEVHLGDAAEIRLNAYPDRDLPGQSRRYFPRARSELRARPRCASCCRIATGHCVPECLPWRLSGRASCTRLWWFRAPLSSACKTRIGCSERKDRSSSARRKCAAGAESLTACSRSADGGWSRTRKWWLMRWSFPRP